MNYGSEFSICFFISDSENLDVRLKSKNSTEKDTKWHTCKVRSCSSLLLRRMPLVRTAACTDFVHRKMGAELFLCIHLGTSYAPSQIKVRCEPSSDIST